MLPPLNALIRLLLGVIEFFLITRFLLKLLDANPATPFVRWIYETSDSILKPFSNMFPSARMEGFIFDFNALFGLFVYIFGAYLITELISYLDYFANRWKTDARI